MFSQSVKIVAAMALLGPFTAMGAPEVESDEPYRTVIKAKVPDLDERSPRTSEPIKIASDAATGGLGQALEAQSTLDVQETNRGAASPILRGVIGPQVSLVLDGIPLNLSTFRTGPNQYARFIPLMGLEAITVTEGPASTLYGQGALGGALHFKTRPLNREQAYTAGFGLESADEALAGTLVLESPLTDDRNANLRLGAGQWRHGTLRTGGGFRALGSDYTEDQVIGQVGYRWSDKLQSESFYGLVSVRDAGRTDQLGKSDMRRYDTSHHVTYHRLRYSGDRSAYLKRASLTAAAQYLDDRVRRGTCANDFRSLEASERKACANLIQQSLSRYRVYEDTTMAIRALADAVFAFGSSLEAVLDLSLQHEMIGSALQDFRAPSLEPSQNARGQFADGSKVTAMSGMALLEHQFRWSGLGRLKTVVGGRMLFQSLFAPALPELGDIQVNAQGLASTFSTQWRGLNGFHGYISFDRGVRLPNLQESTVLGDTGSKFEIPNPELGPETGLAYEVGLGHDGRNHGLSASASYTEISDYISEESALYQGESNFESKPVVQRVNADRGIVVSTATNGWIKVGDFKLSGEIRWYQADIQNGETTSPGRRVPPLTYLSALAYYADKTELTLWIRGAAAQTRLSPIDRKDLRICETGRWSGQLDDACQGTPRWMTLNASYDIELNPQWQLRAQALNLLDRSYKSHGSGFDAAGRSILMTITHQGSLD